MSRIPFPILFLGYCGLAPFLYGAAMLFADPGALPTFGLVDSSPEGAVALLERFGATILAFMGGCLWGFASAADRKPGYPALIGSVAPALFAFLAIRPDPALSCLWLAFGFVAVQVIDVAYHRAGLTPDYWLGLRFPLTAVVMTCLLIGAVHG